MFDYESLRIIWWVLIGVLCIGFAITDGFDMGVGILSSMIGKTDNERRVMINSIAPHWDGNQVWLITAGGGLFAAWPLVYATVFSGFYIAMILALASLWLRPLGFDYRSKLTNPKWRSVWDKAIFVGSFVPPVIFGITFGNLMQGVPFEIDNFMVPTYTGSFFDLLNPFALLCGAVSLLMIITQGATFLQMKTTDTLRARARYVTVISSVLMAMVFIIAGFVSKYINGYVIISNVLPNAMSDPLTKEVTHQMGALFINYQNYPVLWIAPILSVVMPLLAAFYSRINRADFAFLCSSLTIIGVVLTFGFSTFPFIVPSSLNPNMSLTLWDATSSEYTLRIMTEVAFIMVPVILVYTSWCYYKMFGRLDTKYIEDNDTSLY
ncbi:cytochrome d ubiquinol oxidase subunit II [Photobacterium kishitanii]|uniref:cytochrome d ubiquinol oxidase subunit II n=1 Tax=Photobacterium kishitanii TaxID=318456 RepID=UPI0007F8C131|nr:cytochrome d ubiquinol oxidase subunit II [Photobacterium kishitanii]OBU29689.1 cytochrome d ubiquinol oxidase subunit II [Photobacterium kishitanii]PSW49484.1 cytochrome d ubiquinol oxidase subunit II [Photobacterium kishitanii]